MKIWTKSIASAMLLFFVSASFPGFSQNVKPDTAWGFSGFTKPAENPILGADSTKTFFCPVKKAEVKWQRADVFNPAAIVHDGKVFLLTRCEDNPKAILGGRTSRIGWLRAPTEFISTTIPPQSCIRITTPLLNTTTWADAKIHEWLKPKRVYL